MEQTTQGASDVDLKCEPFSGNGVCIRAYGSDLECVRETIKRILTPLDHSHNIFKYKKSWL